MPKKAKSNRRPAAGRKTPAARGPKPVYGKVRLAESDAGTTVFRTDPLVVKDHYEIDYIHSFAEDSPFFRGLAEGKLLGSECTKCHYRFATPRAYCMECGAATRWFDLPLRGRVHTWTTCHFGSEAFLKETPFNLALVEFDGVQTLLLARLVGATEKEIRVGMPVRAKFRRLAQFKPTDVYFVPEGAA